MRRMGKKLKDPEKMDQRNYRDTELCASLGTTFKERFLLFELRNQKDDAYQSTHSAMSSPMERTMMRQVLAPSSHSAAAML
ncbi:hypothetical protein EVAR_53320_1 [Eumeta japonica]|uniref:Uncharacterized protein n=1 Tax=Eumeta variegata TaxID=151549 RepID=A0A4C1X5U4_EUMVA|nr:hypothetical protein EVAR_53320_1 [Eumeta japonica]